MTRRASGSALIIVLGLLSILLILASAFCVNMRVERTAAGNARFGVSTRHMMLATLARAIDDINANMTNSSGGDALYPAWNVLPSRGGLSGAQLAWGESMKYVPASLHTEVESVSPTWLPFPDRTDERGRYAYIIVNVSGFLDANVVGGETRGQGVSPKEISLGCLPEIGDTNLFFQYRAGDVRYETLKEFADLQGGNGLAGTPEHFVVYSRFPFGAFDGTNIDTRVVSLDGDAAALVSREIQIRQAFMASGLSAAVARTAYRNLIDYVDADHLPANENGNRSPRYNEPGVEAVPMINEVWIRGTFNFITNAVAGGFDCSGRYSGQIECAYPFIYPPFPSGFKCAASISSTNAAFAPSSNPYTNQWNITTNLFYWKRVISSSGSLSFDAGNVGNLTAGQTLNVEMRMEGEITWSSGDVVDKTVAPLALPLAVQIPALSNSFTVTAYAGLECIDCRLNHQAAMWVPSTPGTNGVPGTLGSCNAATTNAIAADPLLDGDQWMFVRDGRIKTVGELGNIFFGNALETIRLYNHGTNDNLHPVLDHFTMVTNPASVQHGLVNINSDDEHVWSAVFTNMPVREEDPSVGRVTDGAIVQSASDAVVNGGPYTNLSDIGKADWSSALAGLASLSISNPPPCEIDRESFIRNSAGMLGTRQNLFLVIMAAGPFRISPGIAAFRGDWLSRSRGVALVWRDPFKDADDRNPCFVRLFKVLGDE